MILIADRLLLDRWRINHVGHCCVLPFLLVLSRSSDRTGEQCSIRIHFRLQVLMIVMNNGREKKGELVKSERLWQAETDRQGRVKNKKRIAMILGK